MCSQPSTGRAAYAGVTSPKEANLPIASLKSPLYQLSFRVSTRLCLANHLKVSRFFGLVLTVSQSQAAAAARRALYFSER